MSERWSYEDLRNSGAIICEHISYPERPFSTPHETFRAEPEDSGWQFPCGVENHEHSRASVWALHEVADLDPSIRVILDAAPQGSFERSTIETPWRRIQYSNDDELI